MVSPTPAPAPLRSLRPVRWLALLAVAACTRVVHDDPTFTDTDFSVKDTGDGTGPGFVTDDGGEDLYDWGLPDGFPRPVIPLANPMSVDKVALGRWLFYDGRLSVDGSVSCASCHEQAHGFADPRTLSVGATGDFTRHNAPGLQNVAYMSTFTWTDPSVLTLAAQHRGPLFGTAPVEMGATGHEPEILQRLRDDARYPDLFAAAWPDATDDPITFDHAIDAIASFVRSMVSAQAPVDRFVYGQDDTAMSDDALAGLDLFFSERLDCHHCHGSFNFTRAVYWRGAGTREQAFDNIGLYDVDGAGAYPGDDQGLADSTGLATDKGRFRPPSLRNVALTAPYMHDGSYTTLAEVLQHYQDGGRLVQGGDDAGDGRANPNKSSFVHGFTLTATETRQLLALLDALTDEAFLVDARWSDPFAVEQQPSAE